MGKHEIVALICPSCSSGITQPTRETPFGAELRCEVCGITSVLIINQTLIPLSSLQKLGEKVCTICGRIAQREARFCQDGHSLVRNCINCDEEFSVDHQRCDFCGWIQNVKPGTDEGDALAFERALSELTNPSWKSHLVSTALEEIIKMGSTASTSNAEKATLAIHNLMIDSTFQTRTKPTLYGVDENFTEKNCWMALGSLGSISISTITKILNAPTFSHSTHTDEWSLETLNNLGSDAKPVILSIMLKNSFTFYESGNLLEILRQLGSSAKQLAPNLIQRLEKLSQIDEWLFRCLVVVSTEDALSFFERQLEAWNNNSQGANAVNLNKGARELGKSAIPILKKFCGFFSGRRGDVCKKVIDDLYNDRYINLSSWEC